MARPADKTADPRLANIRTQLEQLLPEHGFRLLDARTARLVAGESVTCDLEQGYTIVTSLVQLADENGKVELRCDLFHGHGERFSTLVRTPLNQLFFCQRALSEGSQLLVGIGAR
jgi:hypothetical protein